MAVVGAGLWMAVVQSLFRVLSLGLVVAAKSLWLLLFPGVVAMEEKLVSEDSRRFNINVNSLV